MTEIAELAARALLLAERNDYSLRVGATWATVENGTPRDQHAVWEKAQELQELPEL